VINRECKIICNYLSTYVGVHTLREPNNDNNNNKIIGNSSKRMRGRIRKARRRLVKKN
jgi:hypothetical protein